MSDTRVVGIGPFRFPWERKWDEDADAQADRELRIAYGSDIPAGPVTCAHRSDKPDNEWTHSGEIVEPATKNDVAADRLAGGDDPFHVARASRHVHRDGA